MRTLKLSLLCALIALALHAQSTSDWIQLKDGTLYYGTYISSDGHTVHFRLQDGIDHEFASSNVQSVYIANPALKQPIPAPAKPQPPIPPMSSIDRLFSGSEYAKYVSPSVRTCMQDPLPAVPSSTGSAVSIDQAKLALQFHNCARKEVGAPPIQWSPALAAEAQKWSEHLTSTVCQCNTHSTILMVRTSSGELGELTSLSMLPWLVLRTRHRQFPKQLHWRLGHGRRRPLHADDLEKHHCRRHRSVVLPQQQSHHHRRLLPARQLHGPKSILNVRLHRATLPSTRKCPPIQTRLGPESTTENQLLSS
jgi:Cysteine-rich secretory protein family